MDTAVGATTGELLNRVTVAFGLGPVMSAGTIAEGLMNRNWRITTGSGQFAVKQVIDVDAAAARRQHAATAALAAHGLPVPAPLRTTSGDTLADVGGQVYAVTPWADGCHREGPDLSLDEATGLGRLLGDLHTNLAPVMPAAMRKMTVPVAEPATAKDKIDRYAALVAARARPDPMDEYVAAQLQARRALLEQVAHLRPDDHGAVGPCGWTHGDFQHLNVLYRDGAVVAVLDWDRLGVRPYPAEVVRSATLLFGFGDERGPDLARVAAFTAGYRAVVHLSDGEVADAVHRLWWERVCDLWQLRRRYEHDDTSCDQLFRSATALLWWWTSNRDAATAAFTTSS
jgi:homoserine kinase type II